MATTTYGTEYVQSSDLVSNWPGSSLNVANRIDNVSLIGNGVNNQTGTSYTLVLADGGKLVTFSNAAAVALTVPTNASVAFPTGVRIPLTNKGAGTVTVAGAGGVTLNGNQLTIAQNRSAELYKLDTNTWVMTADATVSDPGLVLISSTTIGSAVSSVAITGVFDSTYDNYRVLVSGGAGSTSSDFNMTIGAANTGYYYGLWGVSYANAATTAAGSNATSFANVGTFNANGLFADIMVLSPNLAKNTMIHATYARNSTGATGAAYTHSGFLNNTTQYTDFTLTCGAGTVTGGTIKVYGYRN